MCRHNRSVTTLHTHTSSWSPSLCNRVLTAILVSLQQGASPSVSNVRSTGICVYIHVSTLALTKSSLYPPRCVGLAVELKGASVPPCCGCPERKSRAFSVLVLQELWILLQFWSTPWSERDMVPYKRRPMVAIISTSKLTLFAWKGSRHRAPYLYLQIVLRLAGLGIGTHPVVLWW